MANKDSLLSFFDAENERDWSTYRKFLSPDVVWILHSKQTKTIKGIDAYLAAIMEAYKGSDNTFVCEALYQGGDENRIVAILRNNLGERSCDIFEFSGGLIVEESEFILS
ncbi:SnoaL-like domain-containing protein [Sporobacter termitidis DSM 10068]|uniref:SnoaL-like domain-containing protein n=1 Tax=Sporobacter termitidis DSM 10068 TaxID=1123282 RepID=A0A1M5Y3H5_9FIRM|nr:nuclear transport factor 2 family protein [Sporobacter termitidis]SHI06655.1 SnoaL-like domain-containing protein [Sporobacter termitidis DSM 10068]